MRFLILIFFIFAGSIVQGQDTIQIPQDEIEEFFLALDTLETQDSIKTLVISNLEREIHFYKLIKDQDSLLLSYKDEEIELLNSQIELYINRLDKVDKWYNKPAVGFVGGFLSTIILIRVIDYTLPE
jgi:hypothetical protein|tara:strand:+ start:1323 stop:1703 length:381 start_codon:yes stop_codon:yes gene_type:complete